MMAIYLMAVRREEEEDKTDGKRGSGVGRESRIIKEVKSEDEQGQEMIKGEERKEERGKRGKGVREGETVAREEGKVIALM